MAISRFDPFFGSVLGDDLFSSMLSVSLLFLSEPYTFVNAIRRLHN